MARPRNHLPTDRDIDAALKRAQKEPLPPMATAVSYVPDAKLDCFVIRLRSGKLLVVPREQLQGLTSATRSQLQNVKLTMLGTGLSWPDLDVDHYVPAIASGIYGNAQWMVAISKTSARRKAAQSKTTTRAA